MTAIASASTAGASSPDATAAHNNSPYTFEEKRKRIFAIFAASSGNLVEWFDFYVYAFCAIYFAPAFFPKSDPTVQLLNTAGVFAAGFLMRPIGGWLFGRLADRKGRKTSMVTSVVMMCVGSLVIACLPTYAQIGAAAPALLLAAHRHFAHVGGGGCRGGAAAGARRSRAQELGLAHSLRHRRHRRGGRPHAAPHADRDRQHQDPRRQGRRHHARAVHEPQAVSYTHLTLPTILRV